MNWLKRVLGLGAPEPTPTQQPRRTGPMGLAPQCAVGFDKSISLLLDGQSIVRIPAEQQVWSEGVIDLGEQSWLSRYYFDDEDFWLQVQTSGARDGQVDTVILFNYLNCVSISSTQELSQVAGPQSKVGLPTYTLDGKEYVREWGASTGQTELVSFFERVTNPEGKYGVNHQAMLYSRETGLTDRREFLLFSVEEAENGDVSFSTSLGVSLSTTDLRVI